MTHGQDATNAFEEFHSRSKKAKRILDSLPKVKIVTEKGEERDKVSLFYVREVMRRGLFVFMKH